MPIPALADLLSLTSSSNGLVPESLEERLCTLASMLASGTAPDGTPLPNYSGGTRLPYKTWRYQSIPISATTTIPSSTVRERTLAALSTFTIRTNPDGSTF